MGLNTAPVRSAFFDAEVEIPQKNTALPPLRLPILFQRTAPEWVQWAVNMARAVGFPNQSLTATASLDFPLVAAGGTQDLTVTVEGVKAADLQAVVSLGLPTGIDAGLVFHGFVSADDTVTVRATNCTAGAINPASFTFRVEVRRYS